jgi:hypothetical protein
MASTTIKTRRIRFKTLLSRIEVHAGTSESLALGALVARYSQRYEEEPPGAAQLRKSLKDYLDFAMTTGTEDETHDRAFDLLLELEAQASRVWDFHIFRPKSAPVQLMSWHGMVPRRKYDPPMPSDEMFLLVLGVAVANEAGASSSLDACRTMGAVMRATGIRKGRAKDESLRADESQARHALLRFLTAPDWAATVKLYEQEGRKLGKKNPWVLVRD